MDDTHLSAAQYAPVIARLTRERDYLGKLYARMRASRFSVDDPLFAAVHKAWEARVPGVRGRVHVPQQGARCALTIRCGTAAVGRVTARPVRVDLQPGSPE